MRALILALLSLFLLAPVAASADGLPVGGPEIGPTGVELPGGAVRVVALAASGGTSVARVQRAGGRVESWAFHRGHFTIPAVAIDGSPGGLSHDGGTLVLIRLRNAFPQKSVQFAVVSTSSLRILRRIRLRGDFSFDALSPDSRTMYVIQYTSRRDPTRYLVRALDLRTGRLRAKPIVDPREAPDEMRGYALTRASSSDGRWAYTLYDGGGEHPFVHALDTRDAKAVCIDLDALEGRTIEELYRLRLRVSADNRRVDVIDRHTPRLTVNAATFAVATIAPRRPAASKRTAAPGEDTSGFPWPPALFGAAVIAAGTLARARRRRSRT
jgi:hypothetical protein